MDEMTVWPADCHIMYVLRSWMKWTSGIWSVPPYKFVPGQGTGTLDHHRHECLALAGSNSHGHSASKVPVVVFRVCTEEGGDDEKNLRTQEHGPAANCDRKRYPEKIANAHEQAWVRHEGRDVSVSSAGFR